MSSDFQRFPLVSSSHMINRHHRQHVVPTLILSPTTIVFYIMAVSMPAGSSLDKQPTQLL